MDIYDKLGLDYAFCIKQCATWIIDGNYKKVALQLPDNLLCYAHKISKAIEEEVCFKVYILGDTTFGSCCTDEVASEHIGADSIIHFGMTCLSPSQKLPILYVLGPPVVLDINLIIMKLEELNLRLDEKVVLTYDTLCCSSLETIISPMKKKYKNLQVSTLIPMGNSSIIYPVYSICEKSISQLVGSHDQHCLNENSIRFFSRKVCIPKGSDIKEYNFIHIGCKGPTLTSLQLRFSDRIFYHITPDYENCSISTSEKTVMSRSSKIEQLKNALIIGILIGTLAVSNHRDIVIRLKKLIKSTGKRSYTFVIGKPNEPKLANLDIIDVFIYVACPQSSLFSRLDDPYLYKKLVTPWEAHIALDERHDWSLNFELDFRQFLEGGYLHNEILVNLEKEDELSHVDSLELIAKESSHLSLNESRTLSKIHEGGAGYQLMNLSWKGLDESVEGSKPGVVVEGKRGIASSYNNEGENT